MGAKHMSQRGQRTSFQTLRYQGKVKVDLESPFICRLQHQMLASTTDAAIIENGRSHTRAQK
jgi:hypothetical protein